MNKGTGIRAAAIVVLALLLATPTNAKDREADQLPFLDGLSLIQLTTNDISSMHAARRMIHAHGGMVGIMSPPSIMIGWVPDGQKDILAAQSGIAAIHSKEVSPAVLGGLDQKQMSMVTFFNRAVTGKIQDDHKRFLETAPAREPLGSNPEGDAFEPPPLEKEAYLENLRNAGVDMALAEANGQLVSSPNAVMGNSDAMSGTSALTIFFIESDGSGSDPDLYTWTAEHMQSYLDGAATGLLFWSQQAFFNGCSKTWLINYKSGQDPDTQQWTEPILHPSSWQGTWITEIMNNMGYTSGGYFTKVTSFNTWQRTEYGCDRAFSAFVPYNPNGPAQFSDGHTAYAYLGGPFTVLLFKVNGWQVQEVFTHEVGHIYYACDEYQGGCGSCTATCGGVIPTANGNCEACNGNSRECMMRENAFVLCSYTPGQLGWTASPCDPPPPPNMPAPSISNISPASEYQGATGQFTITGNNLEPGVKVQIGDVFVHIYDLQNTNTLVVDAEIINDIDIGLYDVTVTNKDGKNATLASAFEVLPTRKHYYSPSGGNNFPYITPADAANDLVDAINASYDGDTLYMPTGQHNNQSLLLDRGVLLHGGWDPTFTSRDLVTGKTEIDLFVNVTISAGANGAGFDGFILSGGAGTQGTYPFYAFLGGGVRATDADIVLRNCDIHTNTASTGGNYSVGGAVFAYNGNIEISNCSIYDNDATQGGGIYLYQCSGVIDGNTISTNNTSLASETRKGAGVMLVECNNVTVSNNNISGNTGAETGGGLVIENSTNVVVSGGQVDNNTASTNAGGAFVDGSDATFDGVVFDTNGATTISGGALETANAADVTITESTFRSNTAPLGGALHINGGVGTINHNLFVGNNSTISYAAALLSALTGGSLIGNTLDANTSAGIGGAGVISSAIPVYNNIFANTTGTALSCSGAPAATVSYNLMSNNGTDYAGCSGGTGALTGDPLFVDAPSGDYHLALHSPAIDAGEPNPINNDPDGSRGDMGYYGSHAFTMDQPSYPKNLMVDISSGDAVLTWDANPEGDLADYAVYCDTISGFTPGAANFVTLVTAGTETLNLGAAADTAYYRVSVVDNDDYASGYSDEAGYESTPPTGIGESVALRTRLGQNRPNPFNPVTTIVYELQSQAAVTLDVYDVDGSLVRRLVSEAKGPGSYTVDWDGKNDSGAQVASGIYFYRLVAGEFVETRKMVLLK